MDVTGVTLVLGLVAMLLAMTDPDPEKLIDAMLWCVVGVVGSALLVVGFVFAVVVVCWQLFVEGLAELAQSRACVCTLSTFGIFGIFAWYGDRCLGHMTVLRSANAWIPDTALFLATLVALYVVILGWRSFWRLVGMGLLTFQFVQVAYLWRISMVPFESMMSCNSLILIALTILARQCLAEALLVSTQTLHRDKIRRRLCVSVAIVLFIYADTVAGAAASIQPVRITGDDRVATFSMEKCQTAVMVGCEVEPMRATVRSELDVTQYRLEGDDASTVPLLIPPPELMIDLVKGLATIVIGYGCHMAGIQIPLLAEPFKRLIGPNPIWWTYHHPRLSESMSVMSVGDKSIPIDDIKPGCIMLKSEPAALEDKDV